MLRSFLFTQEVITEEVAPQVFHKHNFLRAFDKPIDELINIQLISVFDYILLENQLDQTPLDSWAAFKNLTSE